MNAFLGLLIAITLSLEQIFKSNMVKEYANTILYNLRFFMGVIAIGAATNNYFNY